MSVFHPSARVHDPGGREWEIYARGELPRPRNAQYIGADSYRSRSARYRNASG